MRLYLPEAESKNMDDKGVDIISDFPFYIQCKNTMRMPEPWKIFMKMPKEKPPIIYGLRIIKKI